MKVINDFFAGNPQALINPLFGAYYWFGFIISFLFISSLFIFKKFYAKLGKYNSFKYSLGIFQLLLFLGFYLVHGLNDPEFRWYDFFPFQLCSVLNFSSGILLLVPIKGLFNTTFPLVGPVILAFLVPDSSKWVFGPQHFLYWNFYLIHTIIIFSYLYLYLYGHIAYDKTYLNKSILYLTLFGGAVFIFNVSFGSNYLFIGEKGYEASIGGQTLNTGNWIAIYRFIFMYIVGVSLLYLTYLFITKKLCPFYLAQGSKINPEYQNKNHWFKKIVISIKTKINKKNKVLY